MLALKEWFVKRFSEVDPQATGMKELAASIAAKPVFIIVQPVCFAAKGVSSTGIN